MYEKPISYSGLSLYRKCPRAWHDVYVLGNRKESGAAASRGTRIHKALDAWFKDLTPYPHGDPFKTWGTYMFNRKNETGTISEFEFGVSHDWKQTDFEDMTANMRGAMDLFRNFDYLHIRDWKTGKRYETHDDQADYYAAMSTSVRDDCKVVVGMVYLDNFPVEIPRSYTAPQVIDIRGALADEIAALRLVEDYPPTPSAENCNWCDLSWRRGGKCDKAP